MSLIRLIKLAQNFHKLELPDINIWFSYETPIAFKAYWWDENEITITKNIWSSTTGKHLNMINGDKSIRIDNHEFIKLLQEALQ